MGKYFQTKQGSRPSCRDQEGRKGSEEGVPENLGVRLEGDRDFGELCGSHQGCHLCFCFLATVSKCPVKRSTQLYSCGCSWLFIKSWTFSQSQKVSAVLYIRYPLFSLSGWNICETKMIVALFLWQFVLSTGLEK